MDRKNVGGIGGRPTVFKPAVIIPTPKKVQKIDYRNLSNIMGALRASTRNLRDLENFRTGEEVEQIEAAVAPAPTVEFQQELADAAVANMLATQRAAMLRGKAMGQNLLQQKRTGPGGMTEQMRQELLVKPFEDGDDFEGFQDALVEAGELQTKRGEEIDHFNMLLQQLAKEIEKRHRNKTGSQ